MYNFIFCFNEIYYIDKISRKPLKNYMEISRFKKITVSYTGKNLVLDQGELSIPFAALTYITGQKCAVVPARQSVSSWKLRKNTPIGCKVTLRRRSAYTFINKLYIYGLLYKSNYKGENLLGKNCFGVKTNNYFFENLPGNNLNFKGFNVSIV